MRKAKLREIGGGGISSCVFSEVNPLEARREGGEW